MSATASEEGPENAAERRPSALDEPATDPRVARSQAKVMAAAREILVESGASALTVDAVAERSGVAKSTFYRHWPSRAALVHDVFREAMPTPRPVDESLPFDVRLRTYIRAVAASFADPDWTSILAELIALRREFPEIDELTQADRADKLEALGSLLAQGAAEGRIPAGLEPDTVAATLIGPSFMSALSGHPDRVLEAADYAVDRFLISYGSRATS